MDKVELISIRSDEEIAPGVRRMKMTSNPEIRNTVLGEVVESNTGMLVAEVLRDRPAPAFGAWVQVRSSDERVLYGVVGLVEQGSVMPQRRAVALGRTQDELRREMPHVMELLRTSFRAHILAYRDPAGRLHQTLPPHPPAIHDFVLPCTRDEIRELGTPYDFLRTLMHVAEAGVPVDDLLVAVLRQVREHEEDMGNRALIGAGRVLSRLLRDNHERLLAILRRVG
jgi:hypothetical protein